MYFRCLMLFYFRKGKSALKTKEKICSVYGRDAVTERVCQRWFKKFRGGVTIIKDKHRRDRRSTVTDDDEMRSLIANRYTTREIAKIVKIRHGTVIDRLYKLGYVNRLDVWVPKKLSDKHLIDRISVCELLLRHNQCYPFLKRLITSGEKWISYYKKKNTASEQAREESLTSKRPRLNWEKFMLYIWWDWKGVVYYDLLPEQTKNTRLDADKYCAQLDKLEKAIAEKRPELSGADGSEKVLFHHSFRPHTCLTTRKKLLRLGWDIGPHPAHSPDINPSDYHLFRSLQGFLNGETFTSLEDCKSQLQQFFVEKTPEFYEQGIMELPERWQKIAENNGDYIPIPNEAVRDDTDDTDD